MRKLLQKYLPLNRKERFYTGTVFPMIVGKENHRYLPILFSLFKETKNLKIPSRLTLNNTQFFTEYSLKESLPGSGRTFNDLPETKDTPDIIIFIDGPKKILIALEAKMYDQPSKSDLITQMSAQSKILNSIKNTVKVDAIIHYALLPEGYIKRTGEVPFAVITWESILSAYKMICQGDHFYELLTIALEDYPKLVSNEVTFGKNNEGSITGGIIYHQFKEKILPVVWMGRAGGIHGGKLQTDLRSGKWRSQKYETRSTPPPGTGKNWFKISEFVMMIDSKK